MPRPRSRPPSKAKPKPPVSAAYPQVDRRKGPRAILVYSDIFPSCLEAVETVLARMMGKLTELGCLDGQRDEVDLALREALVNAVKHGNRGQLNKRVELDCFQQHDGGILLVVRDEGPGFDPAHIADPTEPDNIFRTSGRGILLIRSFMDEVQFQRGGREIRMKKQPTRSS